MINSKGQDISDNYKTYQERDVPWTTDKTIDCIVKYRDGSLYLGQMEYGDRYGSGIMIYVSGYIYEGEWSGNNKRG